MAIQCGAVADSPSVRSASRTASAKGPPPGTISSLRDRAPVRIAAKAASRLPASASSPPPTFTTISTTAPLYVALYCAQMRVLTAALFCLVSVGLLQAQRAAQNAPAVNYITGVVQSAQG